MFCHINNSSDNNNTVDLWLVVILELLTFMNDDDIIDDGYDDDEEEEEDKDGRLHLLLVSPDMTTPWLLHTQWPIYGPPARHSARPLKGTKRSLKNRLLAGLGHKNTNRHNETQLYRNSPTLTEPYAIHHGASDPKLYYKSILCVSLNQHHHHNHQHNHPHKKHHYQHCLKRICKLVSEPRRLQTLMRWRSSLGGVRQLLQFLQNVTDQMILL